MYYTGENVILACPESTDFCYNSFVEETKETPSSVSIRPYQDNDYSMVKKNLEDAKMFDEVWDSRENLASMVDKDSESVLVATDAENLIGSVVISPYGDKVAYIFRLVVQDVYRGKGIGSKLLQEAEEIVKSRGVKEVALFIDSTNDDLKDYYQNRGYQTSNKQLITMWKSLK